MEVTLSLWPSLITIFTLLLTISILCRTKLSSSSSTTEWPIGPKTLPIIGNLHQLGAEVQHVALSKLAKLHGGVMTIWIGSWRPVIVVSNIAEAWEVLVSKSLDYAARGPPEATKLSTAGWRTVSTSDPGQYWHNLRKGLQNGPLSPINVSAQMHFQERDIEHMINDMQEEAKINGGIVKPLDHLKRAAVRLLSRLIFGQTFDDKLFIESMHHQIDELIRMSGYFHLSEAFSYAKYLPSHRRAVKQLRQINLAIKELVQPFLASSPPSNSYLNFLLSQDYPHDVVVACITELYVLGVDSTSATTTWALAFLIHDQTAQENLVWWRN